MALTDQPYLPLYVDDWMNNTKLKMCSPGAHGLMISIMCLMHKSDMYGIILLKQKFKQSDKQDINFAYQIAKLTSFDLLDTTKYFNELLDENVLKIDDDKLICERMVKDASVSKNRALSGKKGGVKTQSSAKDFALAKSEANTGIGIGIENGIENEYVNDNESGKTIKSEKPKIDFEAVIKIFNSVCNALPAVQKLTPQRSAALKNRIGEVGLNGLGDAFQKVAESRFLNGENDKGWTADFDWILKPANFQKIVEGKYKNNDNGKGKSNSGQSRVDYSDDFKRKIAERLQSGQLPETRR